MGLKDWKKNESGRTKSFVLKARSFSKKRMCIAVSGLVCVAVILGCGAWALVDFGAIKGAAEGTSTASAWKQASPKGKDEKKNASADKVAENKEGTAEQDDEKSATDVLNQTAEEGGTSGESDASGTTAASDDGKKSKGASTTSAQSAASDIKAEIKTNSSKSLSTQTSSSGASADSASSSKKNESTHQHNWVAQTKTVHHEAQYRTVHHDAVTHQVWHEAVVEEHYICNQCGADITSDPWGHIRSSLLSGGDCGGYHSYPVTVQAAYQETVVDQAAYDEQVQTSAAWDESVTTGYKCSTCGAVK